MLRRLLLPLCLTLAPALLGFSKPDSWLQVRSQHFVVISNASEKDARHVADQFEKMRSMFQAAFPRLQVDPPSPIIVIAVKNDKDFRALEPADYLAKGMLKLGGLFLRVPDKNYVLLRLDIDNEQHPYAVVYHEYTHLLCSKAEDWMPLWLNEGFAQFFENTDIRGKDISSGEPSINNILLLRQNKLLPLSTLLAVDHSSPYYHEENKGSIFYAESWALTHYFEIQDETNGTHHLADYIQLVAGNIDPVTAGTKAFGDLNKLQKTLELYVTQGHFMQFAMKAPIQVDDSAFVATPLTTDQADAIRADFLAYNRRTEDAKSLLENVLKDDPKNAQAHETMGHIEFQSGNLDKARSWYQQAINLDSQSYLAHYYFAAISLRDGPPNAELSKQVEASLRAAIKLNPDFAPSYDLFTVLCLMRRDGLEEAHHMSLMAVQLDPGNVRYRVNAGEVLMQMNQAANAIMVFKTAKKMARTPEESEQAGNALMMAERFQNQRNDIPDPELVGDQSPQTKLVADASAPPVLARVHELKGPKHQAIGLLKDVRCSGTSAMEFNVVAKTKTTLLHSDNYMKIEFSALGFTPSGDLNPCTDLQNLHGRVQFVDSATAGEPGQVVAVELSQP